MPVQLYFIRHGETEWSRLGRHTSRTDLDLTLLGITQASRLKARLEAVKFTAVLTSPRLRARHTCELAGLSSSSVVEADLAEWEYGDYEGLLSTEIRSRHPGWNIYRDGCPGGESPAAITARVDRLIARLRQFEGPVAAFAHGHLGRVLVARWLGQPLNFGQQLALDPASLSVLGYDSALSVPASLQRWNETTNA